MRKHLAAATVALLAAGGLALAAPASATESDDVTSVSGELTPTPGEASAPEETPAEDAPAAEPAPAEETAPEPQTQENHTEAALLASPTPATLPAAPTMTVVGPTCEVPTNTVTFVGPTDARFVLAGGTRLEIEVVGGTMTYEGSPLAGAGYGTFTITPVVYDRDDQWPDDQQATEPDRDGYGIDKGDIVYPAFEVTLTDPKTLPCTTPVDPAVNGSSWSGTCEVNTGGFAYDVTVGSENGDRAFRVKALGDGTGGTGETYYRADGTTGAPGEVVTFATVGAGESATLTLDGLAPGDYRIVSDGSRTIKNQYTFDFTITDAGECPVDPVDPVDPGDRDEDVVPGRDEPTEIIELPLTDGVPTAGAAGTLATTGGDGDSGALVAAAAFMVVAGGALVVARRRSQRV
ncbi:hypothetical protein ACFQZV_02490 [Microbacterium koreense]|uniref:Gram-positive cocci surface proteins LPxTG domain-containing protein n=1 Tax=Microbacterium koreense TaxID=323761 RepID=A0ABW2ZNI4_9MICO